MLKTIQMSLMAIALAASSLTGGAAAMPVAKDFHLKGQIQDAAGSIMHNIAEGFERRSRKEYLNFLNIAKGSAGEVRSQLFLAHRIGYLEDEDFELLRENAKLLSGSIANHMKSISRATPTS